MANTKVRETVEDQEHLSLAKLKKLYTNEIAKSQAPASRPEGSLSHLIDWVENNFVQYLIDQKKVATYLHSSIVIDGQLMEYCQNNKLTIRCLYRSSIISWKTDEGYEKFFAQGIFHIFGDNLEFITSALFHKRTNNEDEISFFNLVSEKNYEAYIKFRNDYDQYFDSQFQDDQLITVVNEIKPSTSINFDKYNKKDKKKNGTTK